MRKGDTHRSISLDCIDLARGGIEDAAVGHAFAEFLIEPVAGLGIAVREHDCAGFGLYGVVGEFLAVGVPAEVKLLDGGT